MDTLTKQNRIEYLDFLREGATLAVVFFHCQACGLPGDIIHVLTSWCNAMFLAITGALFLRNDKQITEERMIKKYMFRLLCILVLWGFVYNSISLVIIEKHISLMLIWQSLKMVVTADVKFAYQFWYLYMLVGIYLLLPLIKAWTDKQMCTDMPSRECKLVFGVLAVLSIVLLSVRRILGMNGEVWFGAFITFSWPLFYVLSGKWFGQWKLAKKCKLILLLIAIAHLMVFSYFILTGQGERIQTWHGATSIFTAVIVALLFDTMRSISMEKVCKPIRTIMKILSEYSLGIYIFHVMVLQLFRKIGLNFYVLNQWIAPIAEVVTVVPVCIGITYLLKKIGLKKLVS